MGDWICKRFEVWMGWMGWISLFEMIRSGCLPYFRFGCGFCLALGLATPYIWEFSGWGSNGYFPSGLKVSK